MYVSVGSQVYLGGVWVDDALVVSARGRSVIYVI